MTKETPSRLALGVALFVVGLILLFNGQNRTDLSTSTFAQEPVKVEGFSIKDEQNAQVPKRILIPNLNIDLEVEKSKIIEGYWEVFSDKAGWGEGSGIPGQKGNQVIFAHAREGLFLPLRSIKVDMNIYVLTDLEWFKYKVSEVKEVNPSETEVIAPTEDEILTLYTCSGFKDSKRLIVKAKRI